MNLKNLGYTSHYVQNRDVVRRICMLILRFGGLSTVAPQSSGETNCLQNFRHLNHYKDRLWTVYFLGCPAKEAKFAKEQNGRAKAVGLISTIWAIYKNRVYELIKSDI